MWVNLLYTMLTLLALALVMLGLHNATNIWRFLIADVAGGVVATIALHAVLDLEKDTWLSNTLLVIFCAWVSYLLWGLGTGDKVFATYEERIQNNERFVPEGTGDDEDEDEDDAEQMYTFEVIDGEDK